MPVTNTSQARVELTRAQFEQAAEMMQGNSSPMIAFEETNLDGVVAVQNSRHTALVTHNGDVLNVRAGR
jgi:hypothetical protein